MDDKNELSDIVLNKGNASGSNKKVILAVATLGVVLIIVVMLMNSMNSGSTNNLPQAVLPPKPQTTKTDNANNAEPLFENVEVMQEGSSTDTNLDKIAKKLKKESQTEPKESSVVETPVVQTETTHTPTPQATKKKVKVATKATGHYFIQVGSFSKYEPNKKFLKSITNLGFNYKYHKVGKLNKVLVGPFATQREAQRAKKVLRAKVEPGSFLVKL